MSFDDMEILSFKSVGERLEEIRAAMGVEDQEMAAMIGASPQKWNNWKKGRNRLPYEYAVRICRVTGATTDMIYRNLRYAISKDLADKLAARRGSEKPPRRQSSENVVPSRQK